MRLDSIEVGTRARSDVGDLQALSASIAELGLLHPVVVSDAGHLICGYRRLEAARLLGWDVVPVTVVTDSDQLSRLLAEQAENTCRKDFTPSEALAMRRAVEPIEQKLAEERKREADRRRAAAAERDAQGRIVSAAPPSVGKLPPRGESRQPARTRDRASAGTGYAARTLDKVAEVVDAAAEDPAFEPLVKEMDRSGRVSGVHRKLRQARAAAEIAAEPLPTPQGPFRVIVADPPWLYGKRAEDPSHRGANPYPSMSIADICALPVQDMATEDAVLWLWTTNAHMRESFDVIEAWGFEPRTILTWVKDRWGTGDWLRGQTEHCHLAIRGRPTVLGSTHSTVLHAPLRDHSRKPEEFYTLVESACPGSRLELFARTRREGWEAFGNEVAS